MHVMNDGQKMWEIAEEIVVDDDVFVLVIVVVVARRCRRHCRPSLSLFVYSPEFLSLQSPYLRLRESQGGGQLGSLGQGQILRPLEPFVELLQLEAAVNRPRFPHFLSL